MGQINQANLDKLIALIEAASPETTIMSTWATHNQHYCDTAYCIGGWAAHLYRREQEAEGYFNHFGPGRGHKYDAYAFLLKNYDGPCDASQALYKLFMATGLGANLSDFDALRPSRRKEIMLEVLRHFRDNNGANLWPTFHDEVWEATWK